MADPKKIASGKSFSDYLKGITDTGLRDKASRLFQQMPTEVAGKLKGYSTAIKERFLKDWLDADQKFRDAFKNVASDKTLRDQLFKNWRRLDKSPLRQSAKYVEAMSHYPTSWKIKVNNGITKIEDANGKELAELMENMVKVKGGVHGQVNDFLNKPLIKNHRYQVDDYLYDTDNLGRVKRAKAELKNKERGRNEHQQLTSVRLKDGIAGDDGGHLIANILNGPAEQINYVPMKSALNRGKWKKMENSWRKALDAEKKVNIEIVPKYSGVSKRPIKLEVEYWIDGEYEILKFTN